MNSQVWTSPDGTTPLVPKDDGKSLMISGFTSRELGYGCPLTEAQLERTVSAIALVSAAASNNTATATGESSTNSTDSNTPPPSTQEYLLSIENTEEYGAIISQNCSEVGLDMNNIRATSSQRVKLTASKKKKKSVNNDELISGLLNNIEMVMSMMTAELASPFESTNRLHILKTDLISAERDFNDQVYMVQSK